MSSVRTLVIACDESGNDGENLTRAGSRVFAHASVSMPEPQAAALMAEVRARTGDKSAELKSRTLVDPKNRSHLEWFLAKSPMVGRGFVHLTDKNYFICSKLLDLVVEEHLYTLGHDLFEHGRARRMAHILYREGPVQLGDDWLLALDQFNDMMRLRVRTGQPASLNDFYETIEGLRPIATGKLAIVLRLVHAGRAQAEAQIAQLGASNVRMLQLDPMFAALGAAARTWHERVGLPIEIVHDDTSTLTKPRVESLRIGLTPAATAGLHMTSVPFVGLTLVDSKLEPRVQVADLLAGAAREIAGQVLSGSTTGLERLLRPYVDGSSLWGDAPSWPLISDVPMYSAISDSTV